MVHFNYVNFRFVIFYSIIIVSCLAKENSASSVGAIRHRKSRTNVARSLNHNNAFLSSSDKLNYQDEERTLLSVNSQKDVSPPKQWRVKTDKNASVSVISDENVISEDLNETFVKTENQIDGIYKMKIEKNRGNDSERKIYSEEKLPFEVDIVTKFLRIVETQHLLGDNCTAGTDLNLGEGVVDRYAQERFRVEADVAVNRANMLTRLWKYADPDVLKSEYLLHASVVGMVEFDDDIFAGGNCYDEYQYKDYWLFCPYAFRLPDGPILTKNLAIEYKYITNSSEWFFIARKSAERIIKNHNQFRKGKILFVPTCFCLSIDTTAILKSKYNINVLTNIDIKNQLNLSKYFFFVTLNTLSG